MLNAANGDDRLTEVEMWTEKLDGLGRAPELPVLRAHRDKAPPGVDPALLAFVDGVIVSQSLGR